MKTLLLPLLLAGITLAGTLHGQPAGNCDPDSLQEYTTSGIVITQVSGEHTQYFLDEDFDGTEDLILNFGPWWYTPKNSAAERPLEGDTVEIEGGLNPTNPGVLPVLIVYEIDGEFWRNPYNPFWNDFSNHYNSNPQGNGYASGWPDSPVTEIMLSGTAIVDTTFKYYQYYLDVNSDDSADYHLNFGPYWYEPASDVELPEYGDQITVEGWLIERKNLPCVLVLVLNDSIWRDTSGIGPKVGEWIREQMAEQTRFRAFWDSSCHVTVQPGWHSAGMPDSLYMQMIQVMVQNMPMYENQNGFAGFEIGMFNRNRQNHMQQNMWQLTFNNPVSFQFHYNHQQENQYQIREETMSLKRWRHQSQNWETVPDVTIDTVLNMVSFSDLVVSGYYLLVAEVITGVAEPAPAPALEAEVYPNPAGDIAFVALSVATPTALLIDIVDISGKMVTTVNHQMYAGQTTVAIPMKGLPPGLYFIRIQGEDVLVIRKFVKAGN